MNEKIKEGSVVSSRKARKTYSVDKFYTEMKIGIQNTHAIRDHILPVETALELGVGILTENYRRPYKSLLDESKITMNDDLRIIIEETLGAYPKFQDLGTLKYLVLILVFQLEKNLISNLILYVLQHLNLTVTDLFMEELETNKSKAEDYLDVIIDMHKRFINSEHVEFKKMRKLKKGMGIRYKNNFNLWFQEEIASDPNDVNQGIFISTLGFCDLNHYICFYNLSSSIDGVLLLILYFFQTMLKSLRMPMELKEMGMQVNPGVINNFEIIQTKPKILQILKFKTIS